MSKTVVHTYFKDKKITLMGLGLLGRGIGDAAFLAECGAELTVTDLKTEQELASSLKQLKKYKNITYVLGEHRLEDFENCDMVIKAAGVSLDSPFIEHARMNGVLVTMDESLFVETAEEMGLDLNIIGITGTRGKSSTTHMIYDILKKAKKRVHIGGNIRGHATLPLLAEVKKNDHVVLELSSWQLQGFGEIATSPHIAVFTSFYDDHLNYYGTRDRYWFDKSLIYRYQDDEDFLVVSEQVQERIMNDVDEIDATIITTRTSDIDSEWKLRVPGEHMRANAACALAVMRILDIDDNKTRKALETFHGVEGRLQFVNNIRGIEIFNDNNATTPEATIFALQSLGDVTHDHKNVILIAGGADKKLALGKLTKAMAQYAKEIILLAGDGTDRLVKKLDELDVPYKVVTSLEDGVHEAFVHAQEGDTILFSPAFASFNMYKNEYERNDEFLDLVRRYE
jgi:UDP-N-acetylmuramoylalanine--D-glutamate ligase